MEGAKIKRSMKWGGIAIGGSGILMDDVASWSAGDTATANTADTSTPERQLSELPPEQLAALIQTLYDQSAIKAETPESATPMKVR
jgi:hypothetical protein